MVAPTPVRDESVSKKKKKRNTFFLQLHLNSGRFRGAEWRAFWQGEFPSLVGLFSRKRAKKDPAMFGQVLNGWGRCQQKSRGFRTHATFTHCHCRTSRSTSTAVSHFPGCGPPVIPLWAFASAPACPPKMTKKVRISLKADRVCGQNYRNKTRGIW